MDRGWPEWQEVVPVVRRLMAGMTLMKPYPRAHNYSVMRSSVDTLGIRISIKVDPNFNREFRLNRDWRRKLSTQLGYRVRAQYWPRPDTRPTACRIPVACGEGPVLIIEATKISPYSLVV